jgi:catalase
MATRRSTGNGSRSTAARKAAATGNGGAQGRRQRGGPTETTTPSLGAGAGGGNGTAAGPGMIPVPRGSKVPAQDSDVLTTSYGQRLSHTDDSLKAGERGPTLLEDFHLREKIMHFDHERIPERVVHARGVGVHGVFESYGTAAELTCADFLQPGKETPVFVRFSTVVGSRGSADTVRDARGFAVKFYTQAGNFDLVSNNIPVFFIRDGIKFPDLVHAIKPEPDKEIPQASAAHTTFWDFVSLIPESPHMLMWLMSDRAIPRSLRMMEGFAVHTFRLVAADGATSLVKFHWKPKLGVHGLLWEEAQTIAGFDPDFHRRDLYNAIGAGAFPEWELGVQVFPDTEDQLFEGIDLLDATKIVPEELAPVRPIGKMTLNRNPVNFFAETEQAAFHPGHLVQGIDITDDPLLHGRLFSYLDTQLLRLGGPNFNQIPINRPVAPVNDNHRDGFMQMAVHHGRSPYLPNSVGGGCPFLAPAEEGGYVHVPRLVSGSKTRERVDGDDYGQARMFWNSMTAVERDHLVNAFRFELGKVEVVAVQERMVARLLLVDPDLGALVAAGLGIPLPESVPPVEGGSQAPVESSPALSMVTDEVFPADGRVVQILATDGCDVAGVRALKDALHAVGLTAHVVGPHKGMLLAGGRRNDGVLADRSFLTARSVEADAVVVADRTTFREDPLALLHVQEAYRHHKPVGGWGDAEAVLAAAGIREGEAGVVLGGKAGKPLARSLVAALGVHRHWNRSVIAIPTPA